MSQTDSKLDADLRLLQQAEACGPWGRWAAYTRLSGPGWLQSAITLGGGSLASSLFLGILGGFSLVWVQPLAMVLGIIMLSAIGYVTLSTQERPFEALRVHVNPVLAWGWILAVAAANVVWCLPQYALANEVLSQNLLPGLFGDHGWVTRAAGEHGPFVSMSVISASILVLCTVITWSYDRGGWGIRLYEWILKLLVAMVVLCFVGVVCVLTVRGALDWSEVARGLVPNLGQFWRPAATFEPMLAELNPSAREYWSNLIVAQQQDVLFSAAAAAVGINMTFLFPYTLLRKGWTREFRGLTIFDLFTAMFLPYIVATGCVVIAAADQFHTKVTPDFQVVDNELVPPNDLASDYRQLLTDRMLAQDPLLAKRLKGTPPAVRAAVQQNALDEFLAGADLAEKRLAAMLIHRQARHLAGALSPLTGSFVADIVFGLGVLGMALSSISLLMLISGFVFCEVFGFPMGGWAHRFGTLIAGVAGAFGPYLWSGNAQFYLAVPTSVFGLSLLPFAYISFFLLMNQRSLLHEDLPHGLRRWVWNLLMLIAASVATAASLYVIYSKTDAAFGSGWYGLGGVAALLLLVLIVQFTKGPADE